AVKLFIARAEAIKGDGNLELSTGNVEAIVAICRQLNGLALCIEIVASFINTYEPPQLLRFLEKYGFAELDQDEKLNNAIGIRYANLEQDEQILFRRLAAFVGWCSFEAINAVCKVVGQKHVPVITTLPKLVDRSLLRSACGRYQMLQVIRDYAREKLEASGEAKALREKCAEYYLALVKKAEPNLKTPARKEYLDQLDKEYENLRAVLDWSVGPEGSSETGLSLAGALFWYWNFLGYFREGRREVQKVLKRAAPQVPSEALASALYCDGGLAFLLGDYKEARVQLTKSVRAWRDVGNNSGLAYALVILGMVEKEIGTDLDAARKHEEESVQLMESLADEWGHALALNDLGNVAAAQGEGYYEEARRHYEASRGKWEMIDDRWGLSLTLSNLSSLACKEHDYNGAYDLMQAALKIQLDANDRWGRAWSLKGLGDSKLGLQDFATAASYYYESFCLHWDLGRKQLVAECLEGLAKVAGGLEQPRRVAYLIGAADKLRNEAGSPVSHDQGKSYETLLNNLRGDMSKKEFDKARTEGKKWSPEQLQRQVKTFFQEWK
ncbi:MAG TPA: hypothetical protein VNI02_12395, partial [Blastocatellia bacterium]|nr:hypothetical protein [Blastocatellia bacterium]